MPRRTATLTIACVLFGLSGVADAKGGGHGGGGHSGHSSGSHGSGGHASSTGHSSRGRSTATHDASTPRTHPPTARGHTNVGQPVVGTAVPRPATPPTAPATGGVAASLPAYPLFGFSGGFGVGLYSYPLWSFGYADTFDAAAQSPDSLPANGPTGGLRLKIEPIDAYVFVDGDYAGVVDDFNGRFHHLNLAPGPHHLEVRAPGYEPLALDVVIQAHHTSTYTAALARSAP